MPPRWGLERWWGYAGAIDMALRWSLLHLGFVRIVVVVDEAFAVDVRSPKCEVLTWQSQNQDHRKTKSSMTKSWGRKAKSAPGSCIYDFVSNDFVCRRWRT
jgi:hypothetical protein